MSFLKAMGLSDEQRSELRERQDMAINGELRMCDEERWFNRWIDRVINMFTNYIETSE